MNSKTYFIERLIEASGIETPRILEMSCGTARYMPYILDRYPRITYVGVEPFAPSFREAEKHIGSYPNVKLHKQLGYSEVTGAEKESFDIVFSLSALEHIKDLRAYMSRVASYVKKDGLMVHRYDLGHALYPVSLKERVHAFLGNHIPWILPEDKFVRYVSQEEVVKEFRNAGCEPYDFSYHQMPNHKALEKALTKGEISSDILEEIYMWEWKHRSTIAKIGVKEREALFPAVTVWSKKR